MKKTAALILLFSLLFSLTAFAATDSGLKITATNFQYVGAGGQAVNSLQNAGNSITAKADIRTISGQGSQQYIFFIWVTQKGKYYDSGYFEGTLTGDEVQPVSATAALPNDKSGVKVETYIWDSLTASNALSAKSVFSSTDNDLLKVFVDGKEISGMGMNNTSGEITFPASLSHMPRIQALAKDLGTKIEIDEVTKIPQEVKIKATSHSGIEKIYTLSLKIEDGQISNAYLLDKNNSQNPIETDTLRRPDYGTGLKPGDDGFDLSTAEPVSYTKVYHDRTTLYYYDIPDALLGKTVIQTSREILANDEAHQNKNNGRKVMGGFDINRSANVYIYGVKDTTDWIADNGYVPAPDSFKISRTQNTAIPYTPNVFVKTFIVEEGKTTRVDLGNGTSTNGDAAVYHALVDFLAPEQTASLKNVSVAGEGEIQFDPMVDEYDIDLFGEHTSVPEISFDVSGFGATAVYTPAASLPGTSTITVTSKDGSYSKTYSFHLHEFENVLKSIKVAGVELEAFDKNTLNYNFALPYGDNEVREITATASPAITVNITQATEQNKTATIVITDMDGNTKTYTVTFVLTLERPSVEKELACSWTGILSNGFSIDPLIDMANPDTAHLLNGISLNHSVVATNNTSVYKNSILYNRIDLSKLVNKADGKPVYYDLYTQLGSDNIQNVTTDIEMYEVDDGIWDVLNGDDNSAAAAKAADIEGLTASTRIGSASITQSGGYWTATADHYRFDITSVVNEALLNEKNYITIGIRLVPIEHQTNYLMRLRVWQNSSTQSKVTYYAYE